MPKYIHQGLFFLLFLTVFPAGAQDPDTEALLRTQNLLRNQAERQQALTTDAARAADRNAGVTALGDPAKKQEIYSIAAELMPWLMQQSQGDPARMNQLMQEFQQNPKAFFDRIPADQRARIQGLAERIEKARTPSGQTRNP